MWGGFRYVDSTLSTVIMQEVLTIAPPERGANHLTLKLKIAIPGWALALVEPFHGPTIPSSFFFWVALGDIVETLIWRCHTAILNTVYDICWYHLSCRLKVEPIKKGGHGQCDDVSRSSSLPSESSVALLQELLGAVLPNILKYGREANFG